LARFSGIIKCGNEPAVTVGLKHCKIIGHDAPTSRLREHVKLPVTPSQLAVSEECDRAGRRDKCQADSCTVLSNPGLRLEQTAPSSTRNRAHHRKSGTHDSDN